MGCMWLLHGNDDDLALAQVKSVNQGFPSLLWMLWCWVSSYFIDFGCSYRKLCLGGFFFHYCLTVHLCWSHRVLLKRAQKAKHHLKISFQFILSLSWFCPSSWSEHLCQAALCGPGPVLKRGFRARNEPLIKCAPRFGSWAYFSSAAQRHELSWFESISV